MMGSSQGTQIGYVCVVLSMPPMNIPLHLGINTRHPGMPIRGNWCSSGCLHIGFHSYQRSSLPNGSVHRNGFLRSLIDDRSRDPSIIPSRCTTVELAVSDKGVQGCILPSQWVNEVIAAGSILNLSNGRGLDPPQYSANVQLAVLYATVHIRLNSKMAKY